MRTAFMAPSVGSGAAGRQAAARAAVVTAWAGTSASDANAQPTGATHIADPFPQLLQGPASLDWNQRRKLPP